MSVLNNQTYIDNLNNITNEIKDLLDNKENIGHINNIQKIITLGDLHADMEILLKFLSKIELITYQEITYNEFINYNNNNNYYYYKYDNNYKCNLYLNNNNITYDDIINNYPLFINKRSYYNIDEDNIKYDRYDYNNLYKINFNIEKIKLYKNTVFVLLGDITDSHFEKHDFNYKSRQFMYVNDIGCYQIVLFLKHLIKKVSNNYNLNIQLRILFGNHEFYELFRDSKEFIDAIKHFNNNKQYTGLYYTLFPNKEYTKNGFVYTLDDNEYNKYMEYVDKDNNFINNFEESEIYKIIDLKFKRRKNIILDNLKDFDFIIIINNQILLSHTFLFKNFIIELKKIISNTKDNDDYYLHNNKDFDEVKLLNILSKYVLHKLKNNNHNNNSNNNTYNKIVNNLFNILNSRNPNPYKYNIYNEGKKQTIKELYPESILCNADNYNNIDNNYVNNSCKNKIHIVGHMPQFKINRNNYTQEDNINNVPIYDNIEYLHKPYYIFDKNINKETKKINSITSIPYNEFYLYYNDNHLSLSFSDNKDDFEKDLDHYYYLEINIDNNNITRKLIQFDKPNILN